MADGDKTPHIARLYRYPVKGFGPERLDEVDLVTDRGVPGDRAFGLTATSADASSGEWIPCSNFVTMMETPDLARYRARIIDEATVSIAGPDGNDVTLASSGSVDHRTGEQWRTWFGCDTVPRLAAAANTGYWDHRDAQVSIINLATLRSLGEAIGEEIDPLRFRANIYLDGPDPWAELAWVGREASLGNAGLRILRPIDRCAVTSVDPTTGSRDVNIPYALGRHFGHVFCGVYGRITSGGRIERGSRLEVGSRAVSPAPAATAPAPAQWPRLFRVASVETECRSVRSFWLEDPFAEAEVRAGQTIRIHHTGRNCDSWRSYTVSGWSQPGRLRITVKREPGDETAPPGQVSGWLHDALGPGDRILASGPHGGLPVPGADTPLTLISGGIGITPTAAILRELTERAHHGPVGVLHGARTRADLALWPEVREAVAALGGSTTLFLSREDPAGAQELGAHAGRMPASAYLQYAAKPDTQFHVCGPARMVNDVRKHLGDAGVDDERILVELFASPRPTAEARRTVTAPGPFEVQFRRSGKRLTWRAVDGSLLELANRAGLDLPAGCRSGGCMTCRQRILSGRVQALVDPPVPLGPAEALLCSSTPVGNVVVDA